MRSMRLQRGGLLRKANIRSKTSWMICVPAFERVYAQFLHDASEVGMGMDEWHSRQLQMARPLLTLNLPQAKPDVDIPVIELFLK